MVPFDEVCPSLCYHINRCHCVSGSDLGHDGAVYHAHSRHLSQPGKTLKLRKQDTAGLRNNMNNESDNLV